MPATASFCSPLAQASAMRARNACAVLRRAANDASSARSASLSARPAIAPLRSRLPQHWQGVANRRYGELQTRDTRPRAKGLIEIVLAGGISVRVDAHVDDRALRCVLDALRT